jgi:hypothetical protein
MAKKRKYYAMHDDGLRNGSFIRESDKSRARYMNGDFMGFIKDIPATFKEVETKHAESLIPKCCR